MATTGLGWSQSLSTVSVSQISNFDADITTCLPLIVTLYITFLYDNTSVQRLNIMENKVESSMETRKKLNNYNTEYEHKNKEINAMSN